MGFPWGTITHGTAKATVSLSNAFNTTFYLRHKVSTAADSTYVNATSQTTSASSIEFNLSGLSPGVGYTVQSSPDSSYASGVQSATFTTPSISSLTISGETHKSATATVSVANMTTSTSDIAVYLRYQASGETTWSSPSPANRNATSSASSPAFTLSGLDPAETYTVEAAFDSSFAISKESATFNTPGISSITAGSITHNSATVSVTVSNPNSTAIYLQYKQDDESSWETPSAAPRRRQRIRTQRLNFALTGLYRFTDFDVRVSHSKAPSHRETSPTTEDRALQDAQHHTGRAHRPHAHPPPPEARSPRVGPRRADDGGNAIDGYRIQWKSGTEVYNTSDRQESSTTTSHTRVGPQQGCRIHRAGDRVQRP